jgi:hypothetical protein
MNFINTDYSNSLLKDNKLLNLNKFNENYLIMYLVYKNNKYNFKIDGEIYINTINYPININTNADFSSLFIDIDIEQLTNDKILICNQNQDSNNYNHILKLTYKFYIDLSNISNFSNALSIELPKRNNLNFHGIVKLNDNNKEYYFFSKQNKQFKKILGLKEIVKTTSGGYYKPKKNNKKTKNKPKTKKTKKTKKK